jgi:homopolymeric O-antigen transport system permease protein
MGSLEERINQRPVALQLDFLWLWEYRELIYFAVWKKCKKPHLQAALGVGWTMLQPLLFSLTFTRMVEFTSESAP